MLVTGPNDLFQPCPRNYDFESEERFTFCAAPPFITLSTEKLKEVVASAKTTFRWQSSKEGDSEALRDGPFKDWMFSRQIYVVEEYMSFKNICCITLYVV